MLLLKPESALWLKREAKLDLLQNGEEMGFVEKEDFL